MRAWLLVCMLVPLAGCLAADQPVQETDPFLASLAETHGARLADPAVPADEDDVFILGAESSAEGTISSFAWHVPDGALRDDEWLDLRIVPLFDETQVEQWVAVFVQGGSAMGIAFGGHIDIEMTLQMSQLIDDESFDASYAALYEAEEEETLHVVVGVRGELEGEAPVALVVLEDDFTGPRSPADVAEAIEDHAGWVMGPVGQATGVSNGIAIEMWVTPLGALRASHGDVSWTDAGLAEAEGARPHQDITMAGSFQSDQGFTFAAVFYDSDGDAGSWEGMLDARGLAWNGDGVVATAAGQGVAESIGGQAEMFAAVDGPGASQASLHVGTVGGGAQYRFVGFAHFALGETLAALTGEEVADELETAPGHLATKPSGVVRLFQLGAVE